jgi:hypothetical protein
MSKAHITGLRSWRDPATVAHQQRRTRMNEYRIMVKIDGEWICECTISAPTKTRALARAKAAFEPGEKIRIERVI